MEASAAELHPVVIGYIASQWLAGRYSSLGQVDLKQPGSSAQHQALALWGYIQQQAPAAFVRYFVQRQRVRSRRVAEVRSLVGQLQGYTAPLKADPGQRAMDNLSAILRDAKSSNYLADPPHEQFGHEDARVHGLANWFKNEFMRWVDPVPCPKCGGKTEVYGGADPTEVERIEGGGRVELHRCVDGTCGALRRFVRYSMVETLMRTREGRCGEWAHLFYIILRIAGLEARYVWNSEDHVWCEYWSPAQQHWVHVDACEAAVGRPLLYARGWGKKQAFCIAIGPCGAEDVTRTYVDDWTTDCAARRRSKGWSENALRQALAEQTVSLRSRFTTDERLRQDEMDRLQRAWVEDEPKRLDEAEREQLGGRTSGPVDWRATRHELGFQAAVIPGIQVKRSLFNLGGNIDILGDARVGVVVLTSGPSQTSAIFAPKPVKQDQSFRAQVVFRLTSPLGSGGADGIAMVFAPERKVGVGGYGLGYSDLGDEGDFAVEVDTYRTQDYADDPPTPHISVHSPPNAHHRHSIACTAPNSLPPLSDGREYQLELLYRGEARQLYGFLTLPVEGGKAGEIMSLFNANIPKGLGQEWFMGITGSCGGLWQIQEIVSWTVDEIAFIDGGLQGGPGSAAVVRDTRAGRVLE